MTKNNPPELNQFIHELRNQLNNIALNGELARLLLKKGSPENDVLAKIDKIVNDTKHTAVMVQTWYDQSQKE